MITIMNAKYNAKKFISITTGLVLVGSLMLAMPAFAQTNVNNGSDNQGGKKEGSVGTPRYGMVQGRGVGQGGTGMYG